MRFQILTSLILLLAGCAHRSSTLTVKITDIEGTIEERTLHESATAIGDARNVMDKFRASNAAKTQSVGFSGEEQTATSTNVVAALTEMRKTAEALRPTP